MPTARMRRDDQLVRLNLFVSRLRVMSIKKACITNMNVTTSSIIHIVNDTLLLLF